MWGLMEDLFPIYRSLLGPGFAESLAVIDRRLPLDVAEFSSGDDALTWTIPDEFRVEEAWIEGPDGKRVADFAEHPYALWIYSRPFQGTLTLDQLQAHLTSQESLPDAFPMRQTYYRDTWGFSLPWTRHQALLPGDYRVHVATDLSPGVLRIGEHYLPGDVEDEILISSYLCHPLGANDNLSGCVVAAELFRMLAALPRRHYSYRLALWPETIGPITYIANHPDRLKKTIGGYQFGICGDAKPVSLDHTKRGDTVFDRAVHHAMKLCDAGSETRPFNIFGGADTIHFNSIGVDIPIANITRGGSALGGYAEYHSSADDLTIITPQQLLETLEVGWTAVMAVERARTYRGTYTATPFLSKFGVFPYQHGAGVGGHASVIGDAYYALMPSIDGVQDLLQIAEWAEMPIFAFDECVEKFRAAGLLNEI